MDVTIEHMEVLMSATSGSERLRFTLVIMGVVVLVALAVWFARPASVLVQAAGVGQSCLVCRQTGWGDTFTLRANNVTRSYRFTRQATANVEFDGGIVRFGGVALEPGCHRLTAREDQRLEFEAARGVRVEVPADVDGCP